MTDPRGDTTAPIAAPIAAPDADEQPARDVRPATGHPAVDDVLASLDGLDGRPVTEHVAVLETAHDRLRAALADDRPPSPGPTGA